MRDIFFFVRNRKINFSIKIGVYKGERVKEAESLFKNILIKT